MGEINDLLASMDLCNDGRCRHVENKLRTRGITTIRELGRELIPARHAVKPALRDMTDWKSVNPLYSALVGCGIARPLRSSKTEDGELSITEEGRLPILRFLLSRELRRQSRWGYLGHVMCLFDWLDVEATGTELVSQDDVISFLRHQEDTRATNTVRARASVIFQYFQWAEETGRIPSDPTEELQPSNFGT